MNLSTLLPTGKHASAPFTSLRRSLGHTTPWVVEMIAVASSSSHILDVRKLSSNGLLGAPRPEIHLNNLARTTQSETSLEEPPINLQDDEADAEFVEIPPVKAGRRSKRVAASQTTSRRPAKRARVTNETPETEREIRTFLALEHVFEMTLNKGDTYDDNQARDYHRLEEEREFSRVVLERLETGEQIERRAWLHRDQGSGGVHVVDGPFPDANQLFIAPKLLQDSFEPQDYDLPVWCADVLAAAVELEQNGRAYLETHFRIQPSGPASAPTSTTSNSAEHDFPFTLSLHLKLFLNSPSIIQPIEDLANTTNQAQRRVLLYILRDRLEPPADFHVNLSHFYGCLKSAPLIPIQLQKHIQPDGLKSDLLPFQRRSVLWMLQREGKTISPGDGKVTPLSEEQKSSPMFWASFPALGASEGKEKEADDWWFNVVTGELSSTRPADNSVMGGLLAEEPGLGGLISQNLVFMYGSEAPYTKLRTCLGKTVESIALILYNTPHPSTLPPSRWSDVAEVEVSPIKATLIVTPETLCKQWADELKTHAPQLRVLQYEGWTSPAVQKVLSRSLSLSKSPTTSKGNAKKKSPNASITDSQDEIDRDTADWPTFAGHFDVILTTYSVLMKELNVARVPIKRPRREIAVYRPSEERSPLIMVEWQRVLMDEVQQVGGGKAAEMVSLIPRRSSWAVSGTPAKAQVQDLIAPLRFMRIHPLLSDAPQAISNKVWNRVLKPGFWSSFRSLFDRYAVRTSRREADGLEIPKQTRFVMPISLGLIERHFYDYTLKISLSALGLDTRGVSTSIDSELNGTLLRSVISKLRMACIHPQVGALGVQGRGAQAGSVVRPISDVLTGMINTNWQAWMTDKKNLIVARIDRSLLLQQGSGYSKNKASKEFIQLRQDTLSLIEELGQALASHDAKSEQLGKEVTDQAAVVHPADFDDAFSPNPELPPTSAEGDGHRHTRQALLARLRECHVVLHRIEILLGALFHQLGNTDKEHLSYGNAERLRKMLLQNTEDSANRAMTKLTHDVIISSTQLAISPSAKPGIKSESLFFEANRLIDVLDSQRKLIFKWRGRICKLLTQKIAPVRSASGNEYQRAMDIQQEVEGYLLAYAALLADRREVLMQQRTTLAAHDDRGKPSRRTRTSARARATAASDDGADPANSVTANNGGNQKLAKSLRQQRQECKNITGDGALRSVMIALGKVVGSDSEQQIAREEAKRLRRIIHDQSILVDQMLKEMTPMRAAFNRRIAYFQQLQELSDSVAEIVLDDQTLEKTLKRNDAAIQLLEDSIHTKSARQRFLRYISQKPEDVVREDQECGICCCDFETGYLLVCGHLYCDNCIQIWRKHCGVTIPCPDCRAENEVDEIKSITFGTSMEEQVDQLQKQSRAGLKTYEYSTMPAETLEALAKVESFGQYGAKIQTLIRHLLLIEETDPGTKSIVFSAWADSLHIIEHALTTNGISCIRIDARAAKRTAVHQFQTDPGIRVLLLHGERENSGLNLTCAKRIMLVEVRVVQPRPTVNISFEIQAIARVDRLGQKEETEVYCYYAIDTVEQNILNIAARKSTSLYTTSNATTAVDLAAPAVTERQKIEARTKDKQLLRGDCIAGTGKMLEVLFPELSVDITDTVMEGDLE
ncbi:hypothetical protein FRC00_003878 [Tulasnella sp. 408]|nr:hypothetical protein FRC00_003878 [Tulasnella sp. 408]